MNVEVIGKTFRVYQGTICVTSCGSQDRNSYSLGMLASKDLYDEAADQFLSQFLSAHPGWNQLVVRSGTNVTHHAVWHKGEWNEMSVEIMMAEIAVLESVEKVLYQEDQKVPRPKKTRR